MKPISEIITPAELDDLYTIHDRLWYEYFYPVVPHSLKDKQFIRQQLNTVAKWINDNAPHKEARVVIVDRATTWKLSGEPARTKPIYVAVQKTQPTETKYSNVYKKVNDVLLYRKQGMNDEAIEMLTGYSLTFIKQVK